MPPGKGLRPAAKRARSAAERNPEQKANTIVTQRNRLIEQIGLLRQRGAASRLTDNAEQLLTRWWPTANWRGREELLRSAEWLLSVENQRGEPTR
jgi:hypothetical protein